MLPNLITLSRIPLLVLVIVLLYQPSELPRLIAAPAIIVLILLDTFDGIVARRRGQTSLMGSVLDIAADRTVELVLWIVYADLDLIPILIPLTVLARGVFVDAIRGVAPSKGLAPFDMMRSNLGRFLVKSPWLRTPYGIVKALAFFFLALTHAGVAVPIGSGPTTDLVRVAAQTFAWLALAFCLLRGAPVLIEAPHALRDS